MDLSLSEEQRALRDSVRSMLAAYAPPEQHSDVLQTDDRYAARAEESLREAGLAELSTAEEYRETLVELGIVFTEIGYTAFTGPFQAAAMAALTARRLTGESASRVTDLVDEGRVVDVCDAVGAVRVDNGSANGLANGIEWADRADALVLAAAVNDGVGLWIVDTKSEGVTVTPQIAMDGSHSAAIRLSDAALGEPVVVVTQQQWREHAHLLALLRAADLVGVMRRVLEMTVTHVKQREQFGKLIGQFQAVQHQLANLAMETEAATNMVNHALWRESQGYPAERFAAEAAWFVGDAAVKATQVANQLHGGIGFMKEYHLHHFHNRSAVQRARMGSEQKRLAALGDVVIEAAEREFRDEFVDWPVQA